MADTRILVATGNRHKTEEIRAILGEGYEVLSLADLPPMPPVDETGETFEENSALKALAAAAQFDGIVLADDSGLEVDALGGDPGVRSARYSGENATDASNRARLRAELQKLPPETGWKARFRCVMTLAKGESVLHTASGSVEGAVILEERGTGGFGYDALFIPEGYPATFGELPAESKNNLSHRARALAGIKHWLAARSA